MHRSLARLYCPCIILLLAAVPFAAAQTEIVLHAFQSGSHSDGANPEGALIADSTGALYGTTVYGGTYGAGTIFKLSPSGTQNILYSFTSGSDGGWPAGSLYRDPRSGNLYGTASSGGNLSNSGTVFELTPGTPWTLKVLYTFAGGSGGNDGGAPSSGVVPGGEEGTLYGTTPLGGSHGRGTVFRLSAQPGGTWKETILHNFGSSLSDGDNPWGGLVRGSSGALYGMTVSSSDDDYGTVYELSPPAGGNNAWTESTVYFFNGTDGAGPGTDASLIFDNSGALYGVTRSGGAYGWGAVFKLSPPSGGTGPWSETVLYSFTGSTDGDSPSGSLIFDDAGALYSTTQYGGDNSLTSCGEVHLTGCGTVFKLTPPSGGTGPWTETTLHTFEMGSDGGLPQVGLLYNGGNFYGVTYQGGHYTKHSIGGLGTVFEVVP